MTLLATSAGVRYDRKMGLTRHGKVYQQLFLEQRLNQRKGELGSWKAWRSIRALSDGEAGSCLR